MAEKLERAIPGATKAEGSGMNKDCISTPEEEEELESRMSVILQNGNDGSHYDAPTGQAKRAAPEFLREAERLMVERGKQYDQPGGERSMGRAIAAFNAVTDSDLTESEGWLLMSLLKRVRQYNGGYHKDSAEDAVAYAALEAESLERDR